MEKTIVFSKESRLEILDSFGKTVDDEGYIIEKKNPFQRAITPEGDDIHIDDFAGIRNGSLVLIKSDITSLIELTDTLAQ